MLTLASTLVNLQFETHLLLAFFIRAFLIHYADFHDEFFDVKYTDIDYKVFTDAARYIVNGDSPYKRHTYRYSPLLALLLTPNITLHKNFGKVLFSIFDILVAYGLYKLVQQNLKKINKNIDHNLVNNISKFSTLFWLYNPLSIVISTRGNADSIQCFFIIMSLFFLQTNVFNSILDYLLSGFFLAVAIHLRLYPLAFSYPMYLSLSDRKITHKSKWIDCLKYFIPNKRQFSLAVSCIITLFTLTYVMYHIYGYEFLFETYIYHIFRKDTKHNFSVLFYYLYLTGDGFPVVKILTQVLQVFALFIMSLKYGVRGETLNFCLFAQSIVMVAYNSVLTSQYFIWFLSLMPLIVQDLCLTKTRALTLTFLWFFSQGGWLFYAYKLEFKGENVFFEIAMMCYIFFLTNTFILCNLIEYYKPGYGFGLVKTKLN